MERRTCLTRSLWLTLGNFLCYWLWARAVHCRIGHYRKPTWNWNYCDSSISYGYRHLGSTATCSGVFLMKLCSHKNYFRTEFPTSAAMKERLLTVYGTSLLIWQKIPVDWVVFGLFQLLSVVVPGEPVHGCWELLDTPKLHLLRLPTADLGGECHDHPVAVLRILRQLAFQHARHERFRIIHVIQRRLSVLRKKKPRHVHYGHKVRHGVSGR